MKYNIEKMKPSDWEEVQSIYLEGINTGIGTALMTKLIKQSEETGIWTLYSSIISENTSSIAMHKKCVFREIGVREKIARTSNGVWHDTVLMERRSKVVGIK